MKTHAGSLLFCTALLSTMLLTACNKPQETTGAVSTMKAEVSDSELTMRVKTALVTEESIKSFDIAVVTTKGDVRLTGVLDTQSQIDTVDKLVRSIEGVHSIHDELTVKK